VITAPATNRIRLVREAIPASTINDAGHGISGFWLPGAAYPRRLDGNPSAPASGPSTTCSLSMTESTPAASAVTASSTMVATSAPSNSVSFSVRIMQAPTTATSSGPG
jgi:hypothetical protein